jgi:iron(III) transport system substrate-binding protein
VRTASSAARLGGLVAVLTAVLACGPGAGGVAPGAPASTGAPAAAAQPDPLVTAAQREGGLRVIIPPGPSRREAAQGFEAAYPGIPMEMEVLHIRDSLPRVLKEREAGIYAYDAVIGAVGADVFQQWVPRGVLNPLEPELRPEIRDNGKWAGGFAAGWMDAPKQFVYGFAATTTTTMFVNRDFVSERDLPDVVSLDQLLDPRWKGKITWDDPREAGPGVNVATIILIAKGEEFLRKLLQDQEVVPTRDPRQVVEWTVRGRYPIALGLSDTNLQEFHKEGVGRNVVGVQVQEARTAVPGFAEVSIFNQAPHPKAAALFANWLLSREGQAHYSPLTLENSRRLDVPPAEPKKAPQLGAEYVNLQLEEYAPVRTRAAQIAKEAIP